MVQTSDALIEIMNDSKNNDSATDKEIQAEYHTFRWKFFISKLDHLNQLKSLIFKHMLQYLSNGSQKADVKVNLLQINVNNVQKNEYEFDLDYLPNQSPEILSQLHLAELVYSIKKNVSNINVFQAHFGHLQAFIRFVLNQCDSQPVINRLRLRALNNNFLNFTNESHFNVEESYSRLLNYAVRSTKAAALIRMIEEQLEHFAKLNSEQDQFCLSFNGGKDCVILLHAISTLLYHRNGTTRSLQLLMIETTEPFAEQSLYVKRIVHYYRGRLVTVKSGDMKKALHQVKREQPELKWFFMGVRRTDLSEPMRTNLKLIHETDVDRGWPRFTRLSPLLDWSYSDVWQFLLSLSVPYCPLYDYGYTSIGSPHNTVPNCFLLQHNVPDLSGINNSLEKADSYYLPAFVLDQVETERDSRLLESPIKPVKVNNK